MRIEKPNFFLFTGGPGVGKTTVIEHLAAEGTRCIAETHRRVIREQMACDGRALPWVDPVAYREQTAREDIAIFDSLCHSDELIFFDRGIPDSLPGPDDPPMPWLLSAVMAHRYNETVFVPPPWAEIYATDAERNQDFAEAIATHERIMRMLPSLGYSPIELPKISVEARAKFVREIVAAA